MPATLATFLSNIFFLCLVLGYQYLDSDQLRADEIVFIPKNCLEIDYCWNSSGPLVKGIESGRFGTGGAAWESVRLSQADFELYLQLFRKSQLEKIECLAETSRPILALRKELLFDYRCEFTAEQVNQMINEPVPLYDGRVPDGFDEFIEDDSAFSCLGSFDVISQLYRKHENSVEFSKEQVTGVFGVAFEVYRNNCFGAIDYKVVDVASRIGLLVSDQSGSSGEAFCIFFLIKYNIGLTAKHCLVEKSEIDDYFLSHGENYFGKYIENVRVPRDSVAVLPFVVPFVFEFQIADVVNQDLRYFPYLPSSDIVAIEVIGLDGSRFSEFPISKVTKWDRLLLIGSLPEGEQNELEKFRTRALFMTRLGLNEYNVYWRFVDSLVADNTPGCYAVFSENGCVVHGCQSFAGFSGAPIFLLQNDSLSFVAVHQGFLAGDDKFCGFNRSTIYQNLGGTVTEFMYGFRAESNQTGSYPHALK